MLSHYFGCVAALYYAKQKQIVTEPAGTPRFLKKEKRQPTNEEWLEIFDKPLKAQKSSNMYKRGWDHLLRCLPDLKQWLYSRIPRKTSLTVKIMCDDIRGKIQNKVWKFGLVEQLFSRWNSFHDCIFRNGDGVWAYIEEDKEHIVGQILGVSV